MEKIKKIKKKFELSSHTEIILYPQPKAYFDSKNNLYKSGYPLPKRDAQLSSQETTIYMQ